MKVDYIKQVIYVVFFTIETTICVGCFFVESMLKVSFHMQIVWLIFLWQQHSDLYGD